MTLNNIRLSFELGGTGPPGSPGPTWGVGHRGHRAAGASNRQRFPGLNAYLPCAPPLSLTHQHRHPPRPQRNQPTHPQPHPPPGVQFCENNPIAAGAQLGFTFNMDASNRFLILFSRLDLEGLLPDDEEEESAA